MEQETKTNDCGCENGDCCAPKPKPVWKKAVSILIILAALAIILIKVLSPSPADNKPGASSENATKSCCDTTVKDSTQKPCCP